MVVKREKEAQEKEEVIKEGKQEEETCSHLGSLEAYPQRPELI